ncbi:helix-turn-helix domain-containing protein [Microtetraspora sp. NBRC 16547]|uniref:TetR/AcrR family transcriptional regulator n=1 Tax=Microtetraspora sp. NBRC 16547 TaxID=3030993 RepID=UPI0025547C40|nr:helix-turn-helix domain-containing protein [Microtetraspora sp. NBRC 16547]
MARAKSDSRVKIVESARALLCRQGYHGTGLAQILEKSGAPRGSTYFLFPGGKEEIAVEAVHAATRDAIELIRQTRRDSRTAAEWISRMSEHFAAHLERSGFSEGLPVTTVTLDSVPASHALSKACREAYESWVDELEQGLVSYGVEPANAKGLATLALATLEGGMVLARACQSVEPLELLKQHIVTLLPCVDDA